MAKKKKSGNAPITDKVIVTPSAPTWAAFLDAIELAKSQLDLRAGEREECFYRGHGSTRYQLLPTLLRVTAGWQGRQLWSLESDLFFEFQARARELHGTPVSAWDILQFMRHHGVATRLLDWTEAFGVALFFATRDVVPKATPCIWLLNPYALNKLERGERDLVSPRYLAYDSKEDEEWDYEDLLLDSPGMGWDGPVALYPVQKSDRLQAQRGYFTIHGDSHEPLELLRTDVVRCVPLHRALLPEAAKFLELAGITEHLLFPDLDGLARGLHRKYKIG